MLLLKYIRLYFLEQYEGLTGKLSPYALAGVGMFHFNPEAQDIDGKWVKTSTA